jgi:putative endonuclease
MKVNTGKMKVNAGKMKEGQGQDSSELASAKSRSLPCSSHPGLERGRVGEKIACRYLRRHLFSIIERNYNSRYGEIDIIAKRGELIIFVEVKARRDKSFGEPFEAVGPRKQAQIKRMAKMWLATHQRDPVLKDSVFRFDVISILLNEDNESVEFLHIKDAFR